MSKKLLMGNEAIAWGAICSGVNLVSGYPGTPSTEVIETIAKNNDGNIYVEWSVNEKVAMEVAAGASYAGARTMVTMKQVGLNVAVDPLMSLSYIGIKGGMVILVADDPGPISSQTEQDTRHFAKYSNLPVYDPSSPEEVFEMVNEAFELSEKIKLPVFLRPTTRICHSCSTVNVPEGKVEHKISGFIKDPKWVIFPKLSNIKHGELEKKQDQIGELFSQSKFNSVYGSGIKGIAASGISYAYTKEVLNDLGIDTVKVFKVANAYPFPKKKAIEFFDGLEDILVIEELDSVIEDELIFVAALNKINISVYGKRTNDLPKVGENSYEIVKETICEFLNIEYKKNKISSLPKLPVRPPVLCAGCPHRASFYAVKTAAKGMKAFFTGDIGCYTLGNAKPLDMVDTCLCMGADITIAQGLKRAESDAKVISFIGDSTFFHTGIPGIVNAVYNNTNITVIILDNSTTAMTGHQPHPGTGKTMMGNISQKIDIKSVVKGLGVTDIKEVNPLNFKESVDSVKKAIENDNVSVIIFKSPCIALIKPKLKQEVKDNCIGCNKCVNEIGCPAMYKENGKVLIEQSLCYGCKLCTQICPVGAIGGVE